MELGPVVFEMMHNLRYIIVWDVMLHFPRGLNSLPSSLRYLEWHNYPLNSLPSNFVLHNLVELKMPGSNLERLWNGVQVHKHIGFDTYFCLLDEYIYT